MNTFKRKALFTAVLAGLGAAGTAEAVYLSPSGLGQVLIYPYYTVQTSGGNSWNTYISVVNTTTQAKAVKVRFIEGKTSAEVLDFNLFLSPNDVWTAAIVPSDGTGASSTSPGHLITADRSCTNPPIPATGVDFRNFQYATGVDALPGIALDRTREGYLEMLEMGVLSGTWATAVTHVAGVPANCAVVQVNTTAPSIFAPSGGLSGTGTLINVNSGLTAGYKADALDAWRNAPIFSIPSTITPNLGAAVPAQSMVLNVNGINPATGASTLVTAVRSDFVAGTITTAGVRAVASVFMHTSVINEYVLDTATQSLTDWVITQPLKRQFINGTSAESPYTNVLTASGACEVISFGYFNREEQGAIAAGSDFSPTLVGPSNALCWESNVLSIRNGAAFMPTSTSVSTVLGSINVTNVNVTPGFQNGWATVTFTGTNAVGTGLPASSFQVDLSAPAVAPVVSGPLPTVFNGLPVTGFAIRSFKNGAVPCGTATCQGNYSNSFSHSYTSRITP